MGIYDNVRKIAAEQGISIYRIEKDNDISNGTIGKWNSAIPSSLTLIKVAKYLNVEMEDLLENLEQTRGDK